MTDYSGGQLVILICLHRQWGEASNDIDRYFILKAGTRRGEDPLCISSFPVVTGSLPMLTSVHAGPRYPVFVELIMLFESFPFLPQAWECLFLNFKAMPTIQKRRYLILVPNGFPATCLKVSWVFEN